MSKHLRSHIPVLLPTFLRTFLCFCFFDNPACSGQLFSESIVAGTVQIDGLNEASGIAASRNNHSVLWTHNDAGGGARLFAFDTNGRHLGNYDMAKVSKVDYEDIAIGPGLVTNVTYLFVGDIGDNDATRSNIKVYRFPEPAVYSSQLDNPVSMDIKGIQTLTFVYPDGAHNAETMFIDPLSGDLFIGTKEPGVCRFYTAAKALMNTTNSMVLSYACAVPFNVASGGAISPSGLEIILRQEDYALLWNRKPGQSVAEALAGEPITIPVQGRPDEPNGEAVGFDATGEGYYTLSDSTQVQPLRYFRRNEPLNLNRPKTLIPGGSEWRYLDTGADAGIAWRQSNFEDGDWKSGAGPFGYGNGDERTAISYGASKKKKYITTYFRKTFTASRAQQLELKLLFDDGIAVYLNGQAIVRANLPEDASSGTLTSNEQEDLDNTWFTYAINPELLVEGANTLAAEVHQEAPNSPDLRFDAQLLVHEENRPVITNISHKDDGAFAFEIHAEDGTYSVQTSADLTCWTEIGIVAVAEGTGRFEHRSASQGQRCFYRVVP